MLAKLKSKLSTSVAYDGGPEWKADKTAPKHKVTLAPGINELSEMDRDLLESDPHFEKHYKAGFYEHVRDDGDEGRNSAGDRAVGLEDGRGPEDTLALDGTNSAPALKAAGTEASPADPRVKLDGEDDAAYRERLDAWQTTRRTKLANEKPAAYKARMAAYDLEDAEFFKADAVVLDADQKAFVADFYALPEADRDAYYVTLSDDEKALVDTNKPQPAA